MKNEVLRCFEGGFKKLYLLEDSKIMSQNKVISIKLYIYIRSFGPLCQFNKKTLFQCISQQKTFYFMACLQD